MPAFGQELNVEEINDLIYLVMYADWNYVYNQAVLHTGEDQAQSICDATPTNTEACEAVEDPEPLYPTVPPPANAEEDEATPEPSADGSILLEAQDPYAWSQTEITVQPGDTIQVVNAGVSEHNFVVDELGIEQDLTGDPVEVTIPADTAPGEYEFICSIPGHAENGMVGTLIIE